jgi:hypothetical protein
MTSKPYPLREFFEISRNIREDRMLRGMELGERLERYRRLTTYGIKLIQAEATAASDAKESSYTRTEYSMVMDPSLVLRITREVLDIYSYLFDVDQFPETPTADRFATARKPVPFDPRSVI